MKDVVDNYPAMMALEKSIGARLRQANFKKNKYSYKSRRENYHTNYNRLSSDEKYIHVVSVAIYCPQSTPELEIYLAPMAVTIKAGVEFRPALNNGSRPRQSRDETKLATIDITFKASENFSTEAAAKLVTTSKFDVPRTQQLVTLPDINDQAERIDEIITFHDTSSKPFFEQFIYPFPFDELTVEDLEQLHENREFRFSNQFTASPYMLSAAAEEFWRDRKELQRSVPFKLFRQKLMKFSATAHQLQFPSRATPEQ